MAWEGAGGPSSALPNAVQTWILSCVQSLSAQFQLSLVQNIMKCFVRAIILLGASSCPPDSDSHGVGS